MAIRPILILPDPHLRLVCAPVATVDDNLRKLMKGVPEGELKAILGGNAIQAYKLDIATLLPIAELVGPRVSELISG